MQPNENKALVALALDVKDVSRPGSRKDDTPLAIGSNGFHGGIIPLVAVLVKCVPTRHTAVVTARPPESGVRSG